MALLQCLQRNPFELLRDLDLRRPEFLGRPLEDARARILGAVDAVAEAMIRFPDSSASRTQRSASPIRATSSSIGFTYAGAPPCSGPESAPTADERAAPQSAPVEATTRAVNVDALSPCSAVQIQ